MEARVHLPCIVLAAMLGCVATGFSTASNRMDMDEAARGTPPPPPCASDRLYETFELGANGWTHGPLFPPDYQEDSWHLASTSCEGDDLGSLMYVSDGNGSAWGLERSKLSSPAVSLPPSTPIHLVLDAVSFDEGGACLADLSPNGWDLKDAGISLDGGGSWTILNDCYPLTPNGEPWGAFVHLRFDIGAFAGQTVQVVIAYDTRDADNGHTFGVDNVRIILGDHDQDGIGAECDCLPHDGTVWGLPGEATHLRLAHAPPGSSGTTTLSWSVPATGGLPEAMVYDIVRSPDPSDFMTGAVCVGTDLGPDTTGTDEETPFPGQVFFYRVRAQNLCGEGVAGRDSSDEPQPARSCP